MIVNQSVHHAVSNEDWVDWCNTHIVDGWKIVVVTATHFASKPDGSMYATHFLVVIERFSP